MVFMLTEAALALSPADFPLEVEPLKVPLPQVVYLDCRGGGAFERNALAECERKGWCEYAGVFTNGFELAAVRAALLGLPDGLGILVVADDGMGLKRLLDAPVDGVCAQNGLQLLRQKLAKCVISDCVLTNGVVNKEVLGYFPGRVDVVDGGGGSCLAEAVLSAAVSPDVRSGFEIRRGTYKVARDGKVSWQAEPVKGRHLRYKKR